MEGDFLTREGSINLQNVNWKRSKEAKLYWKARNNILLQEDGFFILLDEEATESIIISSTYDITTTSSISVEAVAIEGLRAMLGKSEGEEDCFVGDINLSITLGKFMLKLDRNEQKLVNYLQRALQELPFEAPGSDILETKLCSRYLLSIFRSIFEDIQSRNFPVEFDFTGTLNEESNSDPNITKKKAGWSHDCWWKISRLCGSEAVVRL
ncbi:hypothetical protein G6F43_010936 [Rhizopus delemar]|nr:hypothetical protein G6F43_010936 [Rhizopus delemar]